MVNAAFFIILNICTNCSIVLINKQLFSTDFCYPTALTFLHFCFTSVGLRLFSKAGMFERKPLTTLQVLPLALCYSLCTPLSNMSLAYNSVGFYQMLKILTTAYVAMIQTVFYGVTFSTKIKGALAVVVVGVIFASVNDIEVNFWGSLYAVACMMVTAQYQIYVGTKQKELGVTSMQLLENMVPVSAVIVLIITPIMDPTGLFFDQGPKSLVNFEFDTTIVAIVIGSSLLAIAVNGSVFLLIGATSPVTYNVVGHFKTVLILSASFFLFNGDANAKNIFGMALALGGMMAYTKFKLDAAAANAAAAAQAAAENHSGKAPSSPVGVEVTKRRTPTTV